MSILREHNFVTHVAWTFMSEIRPADSDEANSSGRTTIPPRAKRAGEGDGHECPSYGELQNLLTHVDPFSIIRLVKNLLSGSIRLAWPVRWVSLTPSNENLHPAFEDYSQTYRYVFTLGIYHIGVRRVRRTLSHFVLTMHCHRQSLKCSDRFAVAGN